MTKDEIKTNLNYYADYFECMFWADIENNDDIPNGNCLDFSDINLECLIREFEILDNFFELTEDILDKTEYSHSQTCHDLYLTKNGHGCGFWENDYCNEEQGKKLTEIANSLGENNIYLSDDNKLYI